MVSNQLLNPNVTQDFTVVRYMNLAKFLAFIANSELYLSSWDKLRKDDPYEGELSQKDIDLVIEKFLENEYADQYNNPQFRYYLIETEKKIRNLVVESIAINCWRIVECDSYAMWKLYSELEYGIAVTSTYTKLINITNSFGRPFVMQKVNYKNYTYEKTIENHYKFKNLQSKFDETISQQKNNDIQNVFKSFWSDALSFYTPLIFSKRKEFEYENELRIATVMTVQDAKDTPNLDGLKFPVDLNYLIEDIFISPNAPDWLRETIIKVLNRFEINKNVYKSNLLTIPTHF